MGNTVNGFKNFLLRGNVVDLAVGVVIGAAFGSLVKAIVEDLITPIIGIIGKKDFSAFSFTIRSSTFKYGSFINDLVSFLIVASAIYFLIILPMNALVAGSRGSSRPLDPTTKKCPECLSEIPLAAKRCAYCTSVLS